MLGVDILGQHVFNFTYLRCFSRCSVRGQFRCTRQIFVLHQCRRVTCWIYCSAGFYDVCVKNARSNCLGFFYGWYFSVTVCSCLASNFVNISLYLTRRRSWECVCPPSEFLQTPLFDKFLRIGVRTVRGIVHVKFEIHSFNRFKLVWLSGPLRTHRQTLNENSICAIHSVHLAEITTDFIEYYTLLLQFSRPSWTFCLPYL